MSSLKQLFGYIMKVYEHLYYNPNQKLSDLYITAAKDLQ
jgi:hypothetical protein